MSHVKRLGYEAISIKAIKLLQEKIEEEFNLRVICGAELEFCDGTQYGQQSKFDKLVIPKPRFHEEDPYRPLRERIEGKTTEPSEIEDETIEPSGVRYLDRNPYLSHFYIDKGSELHMASGVDSHEAVFSHSSKVTNPLRLAGAIATLQKKIIKDDTLSPGLFMSINPNIGGNAPRGLHINLSLESTEDGSVFNGYYKSQPFIYGFTETLMEGLFFSYPDDDAITRFLVTNKHHSSSHLPKELYPIVYDNSLKRIHITEFSSNTNPYLAILTTLAATYNALDMHKSNAAHPDHDSLSIKAPEDYEGRLDYCNQLIEVFWDKLENGSAIKKALNKASNDKLGDKFMSAIIDSKQAIIAQAEDHTKEVRSFFS